MRAWKQGLLLSVGAALAALWSAPLAGAVGTDAASVALPVSPSASLSAGPSASLSVGPPAPLPVSPSASSRPPFVSDTLRLLGSYGTSPLRWEWQDTLWLAPSVAVSWVTLHNDLPLYRALALGSARKPWLDRSMPTVSALGDGLTEAGLTALAARFGSSRLQKTSVEALQALIIAGVYGEVLKVAAWSNRPYEDDSGHYFWDFNQPTQGMPSGHSFSAFAVAEVYGAEYGREWTYPVAALIAYSRVYNQDHWPSDVVVGSILGVAAGVQARHAAASFGVPNLSFGAAATGRGTPEGVLNARF